MMGTGPDGQPAHVISDPVSPDTTSELDHLTGAQFESSFACLSRFSPGYTGPVVRWESGSTIDNLNVEIMNSASNRQVLSIRFNNQTPIGFLLPNPNSYRNIGFTLRDATTLSVYAECYFLGSVELTSRATASSSGQLTLFGDATATDPVAVSVQV